MTEPLVCADCAAPVEPDAVICQRCRSPIQVILFPAHARGAPVSLALPAQEGDAGCFYHPSKKAVVPCDQCGRFLCALCQIDLLGQTWCPQCIFNGRRKGRLQVLDATRPLYANAAIGLATAPLLFWPITFVTAPMALYVTVRYWKAASSLVQTQSWKFYTAILFAVVELGGWFWLIGLLVSRL